MGQLSSYIILNDIRSGKPIEFIKDVKNQKEVEKFRSMLYAKHNLAAKNKVIDEYNSQKYNTTKKARYQILFSIRQTKGLYLQS